MVPKVVVGRRILSQVDDSGHNRVNLGTQSGRYSEHNLQPNQKVVAGTRYMVCMLHHATSHQNVGTAKLLIVEFILCVRHQDNTRIKGTLAHTMHLIGSTVVHHLCRCSQQVQSWLRDRSTFLRESKNNHFFYIRFREHLKNLLN